MARIGAGTTNTMSDEKVRERDASVRAAAAAARAPRPASPDPRLPEEHEAWLAERARLRGELLRARQAKDDTRLEREALLSQMREANERLVMASVRADELAEGAEAGRQRAESLAARLAESDAQLRSALMAGKMACWRWDPEVDAISASETIGDVLGLPAGTTLQSSAQVFALVHPADAQAYRAAVESARGEVHGWQHEFRIVRPRDHELAWLEESATPVGNSLTARRELVVLVHDITERKQAEELLREQEQHTQAMLAEAVAARAEAEAASRAKDEFLANVNHELRTPLAAILLWARALETPALGAAERARAIEAIVQSARSQSQLIEELLELSRLRSGRFELSMSAVDLGAVVAAAVDMVQPVMAAKAIEFGVQLIPESIIAMLDAHRMKQILGNVLTNAAKFTPPGGQIRLLVRAGDGGIEFELSDNGAGIAPEFMPYVFARFRQGDTSATRHGGLGIGLAITKQLVELHGGTIEAHSDGLGRGALFRIQIPWNRARVPREPARAAPFASAPHMSLAGLRIWVLESDRYTGDAMNWTLAREGADVSVFATGEAALVAMQNAAPDILISELGLPDMSGCDLIKQVVELSRTHRCPSSPPSCAVSGHTRPADRWQAIEAGFDMFLAKPVTAQALVEAMRDLREISLRSEDP